MALALCVLCALLCTTTTLNMTCEKLPWEQRSCEVNAQFRRQTEAYLTCEDKGAYPCCRFNRTILAECYPKKGVICSNKTWTGLKSDVAFYEEQYCRYVTGKDYRTALILSVFLGMFGIDRFYLGYYAIGLLKFCTFGFFLLGQLVDIILIATQTVGPADGSDYMIAMYGPMLSRVHIENHTHYQYPYGYYHKKGEL